MGEVCVKKIRAEIWSNMEWRRFGSTDPLDIKGKNCAIFRMKRKKFTVGRLEWIEATLLDKQDGMSDRWVWVTDYGTCHEVDVEDRLIVLPVLEVTIEKIY